MGVKRAVKRSPVVRRLVRLARRWLTPRNYQGFDSAEYWELRYREGRNSGAGSYNRLAMFKADVVNQFVAANDIHSVIELGCGDGSQLKLADYPAYVGVDVSWTVLEATRRSFNDDPTKTFIHIDELGPEHRSDLSLSLDVIYHLVEDEVFDRYMDRLFASASRYVIIYSSNTDRQSDSVHVRHRRFTDWIEQNRPDFQQTAFVKNVYPEDAKDAKNTSFADFYVFTKAPEAIQA